MSTRRLPLLLASVVGTAVLGLPTPARAAVPYDQPDPDDDAASVPDTIDITDVSATRDRTAYRFQVSYDDLAQTPVTQRVVSLRYTLNRSQQNASLVELRTSRTGAVSVHFYHYRRSGEKNAYLETTCRGLAVVPDYSDDLVRYSVPRACYAAGEGVAALELDAVDSIYTSADWAPAKTFETTARAPEPESSDLDGGDWRFQPTTDR